MEAKYVASCEATKEVVWLKKFLHDFGIVRMGQVLITLFCYNSGVVAQSKESQGKKKHIEKKNHIIRDIVARGDVAVGKVDSANNLADPFTKVLKAKTLCEKA